MALAPAEFAADMSPAELGSNTLSRFAPDFEIADPARDLELVRSPEKGKAASVRYQQLYKGVPVIAGELLVNMDHRGRLRAIIGEASPGLDVGVEPKVTSDEALDNALVAVAKLEGVNRFDLAGIRSCAVDL